MGNNVLSIGAWAFSGCSALTSVAIPNSVSSLSNYTFYYCASLTSVTMGSGMSVIWDQVFVGCTSLTNVYFQGNAPSLDASAFWGDTNATFYYLPGTTGWSSTFAGRPTALWFLPNPLILNNGSSFGVQPNGFGFIISWATNVSVVVEACTNLANPLWQPVATNALSGGTARFSDPEWTNYPARFYRLRSL